MFEGYGTSNIGTVGDCEVVYHIFVTTGDQWSSMFIDFLCVTQAGTHFNASCCQNSCPSQFTSRGLPQPNLLPIVISSLAFAAYTNKSSQRV